MTGKSVALGLGIVASLIAGAVVVADYAGIIGVFQRSDPTGGYGAYLHLGALAANLAVIFVALCLLASRGGQPLSGPRFVAALVVFIPSVLEVLALAPCYIGPRPGALCGVFAVVVAEMSIPVVVGAAILFVAISAGTAIRVAGAAAAVVFIGVVAIGKAALSPADAGQCRKLPDPIKISNCLNAFAIETDDETLCRAIDFRTTRFTCLREVAIKKKQVQLCEEIRDTTPVADYGGPAAFYRDVCFQNLAYALHDPGHCTKIEDATFRAGCEKGVPR